jgi:lipopolysaccharide transport system permease protein
MARNGAAEPVQGSHQVVAPPVTCDLTLRATGIRPRQRWAQVVLYKAFAELRADAEKYYIGYLWWMVEPIIEMAVWYLVFAQLLHRYTEDFVAFLLCGLVPWRWFSVTVLSGSASITGNHGLAMQVFVPKLVFPLVSIAVNTAKFFIVLAVLALFLNLYGIGASWSYLAIPPLIVVQLLFVSAVTILTAAVVPFLPSLRVVLDAGMRIGFALSGIFFSVAVQPASQRWWLHLNPMTPILDAWRDVLMYHRAPDWRLLGLIAAVSLPSVLAGRAVIHRYEYLYPKLTR